MKRILQNILIVMLLLVGAVIFILALPAVLVALLVYAPIAFVLKCKGKGRNEEQVIYVRPTVETK